jgi:hypothetical protein
MDVYARRYLRSAGAPVDWAVRQVRRFLAREAERGVDNLAWLQQDSRARAQLGKRQGLVERVIARYPTPAPTLAPA